MITRLNKIVFILAAFTALTFTSCKKDKFDEPPHTTTDPKIANANIADLRALFSSGNPITITDDLIIGGVVTADDRSGNFYKQFVIQDSTGAIPVLVNKSGLYTDYPIGRKVYIKCKDLVLGQYGKNLQLGSYVDYTGSQPSVGNMPSALADKYIVKGPMVTPIVPRVINSFAELNLNSDQSILIQLDPVSFDPAAAGVPYADIINGQSLSRAILDCDGSKIDARTSNFSSFANSLTPASSDKISVVGIYSIFNSSKQLTIRDLSEIVATTTVCPTVLFYENFTSGVPSAWQNYKEAGNKNWYTTTFSGNTLAKCSAYGSSDASNIAWLITPAIDLTGYTTKNLTFNITIGQIAGTVSLDVLISTDYTGTGDPNAATWTAIPYTTPVLPTGTSSFGPATNSLVNLNSYTGTIYVAYKYNGSGSSGGTTTYEVDDVKVVAKL